MAERATAAIGVLSVTVIAPAIGPMLGGIARRRGVVAVDLPDQRARRHRHGGAVDRLAPGGPSRGPRPARRRRTRAVGIRCVDPALHAVDRAGARAGCSPTTLAFAFVGAACIVALIVVEQRVSHPILTFRLLRDRLFRTINIAVVDDVRRVLRVDLRPAVVPAEPAWLQRVRERSRPVAPGARRVPRGEPARPPAVPGDRAPAADGRRDRTHGDRHVLLFARRARHPVVDDRPAVVASRPVVRPGVRVDPDRGVRHHLESPTPGGRRRCSTRNVRSPTPPAWPWRRR